MSSITAANSLLLHSPPSAPNWPAGAKAAHVDASNPVSQAFESFAKEDAQPPLANKRVRKSTADVCDATNQRPASAADRSNANTTQGDVLAIHDKAAAGIVANHRKEQAMLARLQRRYDEATEPIVSSPTKRVYQVHRRVPLPGSRA